MPLSNKNSKGNYGAAERDTMKEKEKKRKGIEDKIKKMEKSQ